jgi:calcineurin-like phosphoesterase family protein
MPPHGRRGVAALSREWGLLGRMIAKDLLRGPATLLALAGSYAVQRPAAAIAGLATALRVGLDVRRAPVLRPCPGLLAAPTELTPVVSLLSDTHVTAGDRPPSELLIDPGQWPFRTQPRGGDLRAGIVRLLGRIHRDGPRTVVWCGDEVDTGDAAEWEAWRAAVERVPGLAHRLVPGNHDICFNRPFDEDFSLRRRAIRERAYQAHGPRLADYPVVDVIATERGPVTLLLLDSCKHPSEHVLSNAIGRFGAVQIGEVARILDRAAGPLLCIAHHHVWRGERFRQPDEWFNTVVDADHLARVLAAYRRRDPRNSVLVCHGHRHTLTAGQIGDPAAPIDVIGLPSSTLGDKATTGILDGMLRYAIAGLRPDGGWGLALVAVGPVVAAERARPRTPYAIPDRELHPLSPPQNAWASRV